MVAGRVRPAVAPALLGLDDGARLMVLEYLPHRRPGPEWVVDWARTLGRLHAAASLLDREPIPTWSGPTPLDVQRFLSFARKLEVDVSSRVGEELAALLVRLAPGGRSALLHGDPCPDNGLHTGGGVRFVDFEQASLGRGATELAYLRVGFPTCWCVTAVRPELLAAAESAYREQWGHTSAAG